MEKLLEAEEPDSNTLILLISDATILFCALIGIGVTKNIIFSNVVKLYAPEYLFDEFEKHRSRLETLSKLPLKDFTELFKMLKEKIELVPKESFENFLKQANSLISDKEDTEYLALSLSLNKIPIWSNDLHFKQQSLIEVFNTKELVEKLKLSGIGLE